MRAYELHGVNDLRREDIEKPEIPSGWVLVQVCTSGIIVFFTTQGPNTCPILPKFPKGD